MSKAVEQGNWTVPLTESPPFGTTLSHGISSERVIYMVLPRLAGWRPTGCLMLSHQTYIADIDDILDSHDSPQEIAVVGVDTGEWVTVWAREGFKPYYPFADTNKKEAKT